MAEQRVRQLASACALNDTELMRRQAHALSGAAGSFGLQRLGELAQTLETYLEQGEPPDELARLTAEIEACALRGRALLRSAQAAAADDVAAARTLA